MTRLLLETALYLEPAVRVYERAGFTPTEAYGEYVGSHRQLLHGQDPLTVSAPYRLRPRLSFRLGGPTACRSSRSAGSEALTEIGFSVSTVAGDGPVDRLVPGLAIDADRGADASTR